MRIIEKYLNNLKSEQDVIQSIYNSKYKIEDIDNLTSPLLDFKLINLSLFLCSNSCTILFNFISKPS